MEEYTRLLKEELLIAVGCTEPIAVAYASAKATTILGEFPEKITVKCSGNIIKNVKAVIVPGTNNMTGIKTSSILGAIVNKPDLELALLNDVNEIQVEELKKHLSKNICEVKLVENIPNLYIEVIMEAGDKSSSVKIIETHNNIVSIKKNGKEILNNNKKNVSKESSFDYNTMSIKSIYNYIDNVPLEDLYNILSKQVDYNLKISERGLKTEYGANIGKTIYSTSFQSPYKNAKAFASSGSDARMNGCLMPVVINSGSGNQGITASVPIIIYARDNKINEEKMYRALALSNLISIYIKSGIGKLSAFCGAVNAACGAVCGIGYMEGEETKVIENTIINCLANVGGIACDGAKSSCAAKIASSLDGGFLAYEMAKSGNVFKSGEGLVVDNVDETIRNFWRMGKDGMKSTDVEILNMMIGK